MKGIEVISNERRLGLIREYAGEEVLEKLDKAVTEVFLHESESLKLLTDFFALLDTPKLDVRTTLTPYSLENRKVYIVQSSEELTKAIQSLTLNTLIGFDSEQRPTFKKNEVGHGISLIQLATLSECYLIQIKKIDNIRPLIELLENENIIKLGINLLGDKQELHTEFGIRMRATIEIDAVLSRLSSKQSIGAKKAAKIFLKKDLQKSKKISTSNWEINTLSQRQIKYAAEDAAVVLDVTIHLLKTYPFVVHAMPEWFKVILS